MTAPSIESVRFVPVADHGLLLEFADEISDEASDVVLGVTRALDAAQIDGLVEIVPAFVNLLVVFDPLVVDHQTMQQALRAVLDDASATPPQATERIVEVCYHRSLGPDLETVAERCGRSVEAVVTAHLSGDYRLCMYGFNPGYAYLSGVPADIRVPRKQMAVRDVAEGSVIIAGPQCLVTTLTMPTGWSVLGRSPTPILQDDPDDPVRFDLGDRVRFVEIDLASYERASFERARWGP